MCTILYDKCVVLGIMCNILGIGGGELMGPLLLYMKVDPQVVLLYSILYYAILIIVVIILLYTLYFIIPNYCNNHNTLHHI